MTKYFFHVRDRLGVMKDNEGMELSTLEDARAEALRSAKHLIAESKKFGTFGLDRVIEVEDGDGQRVYTLPFKTAHLLD